MKPTLTEYVQAIREAAELTEFEFEAIITDEIKEIVFYEMTRNRKYYEALTWFDIRSIVRSALTEYFLDLRIVNGDI